MEKLYQETVEVVLIHCNLVNDNYKQASQVTATGLEPTTT